MNHDRWKTLRARYETAASRRLLALDGGGIRGLITLGILKRVEDLLRERTGDRPRVALASLAILVSPLEHLVCIDLHAREPSHYSRLAK